MSAIDISKLKNKWMGIWNPSVRYLRNDIVQYRGSSFVCIKDLPDENVIIHDASSSQNFYDGAQPRIHFKQVEISDSEYWQMMAPGMPFKHTWSPMTYYHPGDIVEAAGDLFICIQYGYNRYISSTDYWTKIFECADRDQRYQAAILFNNNPLGWQYNMGDKWFPTETPIRSYGFLGFDGNAYIGGTHRSPTAIGQNFNGVDYNLGWKTQCFSFADWLQSDQALGASSNFRTPTGEPPKCIQWALGAGDNGTSLFLMDNGEVYSVGRNSEGQQGQGNTTSYYYPVRVHNTATTDYLGNAIKSFSTTKMVKVGLTSQGWQQGSSTYELQSSWSLGEDGTVWCWGYNAYGQLSFGSNVLTASVGAAETNQTSPVRIPSSFFDYKKIVDIMPSGGYFGRIFFLDEDGYLWWGGVDFTGGTGSGNKRTTTTGNYYRIQTPQRIPINWKKHGGMKKLCTQDNSPYYEFTFILDGDGYMWMAGRPNNTGISQWHSLSNSGTTDTGTSGFIRLNKDWYAEHEIENFWMVGGVNNYNLYFREKGTGITYVAGSNIEGNAGQFAQHRYGSTTFNPIPKYLRGPRYAKQAVTFDPGHDPNPTICIVTDDGQAWGNGNNGYGSLSFGYSGSNMPGSYWPILYKDVSSQNQFRRCKLPQGLRINMVGGFGWTAGHDGSIWQLDDGSVMIAGTDGDSWPQALQNDEYPLRVGAPAGSPPAYVMHGLSGH
jgi:alpha-tubulin suppressor-like RCC1 family protein